MFYTNLTGFRSIIFTHDRLGLFSKLYKLPRNSQNFLALLQKTESNNHSRDSSVKLVLLETNFWLPKYVGHGVNHMSTNIYFLSTNPR